MGFIRTSAKSRRLALSLIALSPVILSAGPTLAQAVDMVDDLSPTLLVETGPSDNPNYRRMVFVKFIADDRVTVNYKAYNRTEFIQVPDATPDALIAACVNGPSATLEDIRAFETREAEAVEQGETPEVAHFCIKNVPDWEAENRSTYLDPIFNSLPYAARLNN